VRPWRSIKLTKPAGLRFPLRDRPVDRVLEATARAPISCIQACRRRRKPSGCAIAAVHLCHTGFVRRATRRGPGGAWRIEEPESEVAEGSGGDERDTLALLQVVAKSTSRDFPRNAPSAGASRRLTEMTRSCSYSMRFAERKRVGFTNAQTDSRLRLPKLSSARMAAFCKR